MPDPTKYTRDYDFGNYQANNPNRPLPGPELDIELDDISNALNGTIDALTSIRRSDGRLQNGIVDAAALDPAAATEFNVLIAAYVEGAAEDAAAADAAANAASASAIAAAASEVAAEAAAEAALAVATGSDFEHIVTSGTVSSYTFPFTPASIRNVALFVGGVRQLPGTHYTLAGDTVSFGPVEASTDNPVFIQARFALPDGSADAIPTDSGLTVQQELDRIGRSYFSRAAAIAAAIPVDVNRIWVLHDGVWLDYVRDATGTALVTDGGVEWSPASTITVRHWGAVGGATMAVAGTVTGTDCTAAAQAMLAWVQTFRSTGAARGGAIPTMEWGRGNFRVSGSLNLTIFNTNERMVRLTGYGTTIYADGAGARVFDLTDAQYIEVSGFTIIGSANSMPLCAVKTGRKGNNDGAAYITLKDIRTRAGTDVAVVRSFFSLAALWQVASETSREENCIWESHHNGAAAYGAAYDNINALGYGQPKVVTSMTAVNPAVFTSAGHGFVNGDKVVATVRSTPTLVNSVSQTAVEGKLLTVADATADTFTLLDGITPVDGTALTLSADTAFCEELIAPSTFITSARLEPFKRHSQLHNVRHGNTYFNHEGKAAVFQGCCEGVTFDQCFIVGEIGFHLVYTQQRSANDLHWTQTTFGDHLEGGGTTGNVEDWMLIEPATTDAGTVARFNRCRFQDNAMQAKYMVNQGASVTPRFVDCEFSVGRNTTSFLGFARTPADVYVLGGTVGLGDLVDFNLTRANCTATLIDYALEDFQVDANEVLVTENFNAVTQNNRVHRNVTSVTTGVPTPTANWHMVNWDRDDGAGTAEQIAVRDGLQVLRRRAGGTLGAWKQPNSNAGTVTSNANINLTWLVTGQVLADTATLTADRTRTLLAADVPTGATITITRTGGGAFNANIVNGGPGAGTMKALATNQWADFHFDGTNWRLIRFGSL